MPWRRDRQPCGTELPVGASAQNLSRLQHQPHAGRKRPVTLRHCIRSRRGGARLHAPPRLHQQTVRASTHPMARYIDCRQSFLQELRLSQMFLSGLLNMLDWEADAHRFHIHAARYLQAAKLILGENGPADSLIAPCCQNIGLSLELFLKARALEARLKREDLRALGHKLVVMWNAGWASKARLEAEKAAAVHMDKIFVRPGERRLVDLRPPKEELIRELEWLDAGYSNETEYALRYPRDKTTTVPSPEFLIPILDHLIDAFYK